MQHYFKLVEEATGSREPDLASGKSSARQWAETGKTAAFQVHSFVVVLNRVYEADALVLQCAGSRLCACCRACSASRAKISLESGPPMLENEPRPVAQLGAERRPSCPSVLVCVPDYDLPRYTPA